MILRPLQHSILLWAQLWCIGRTPPSCIAFTRRWRAAYRVGGVNTAKGVSADCVWWISLGKGWEQFCYWRQGKVCMNTTDADDLPWCCDEPFGNLAWPVYGKKRNIYRKYQTIKNGERGREVKTTSSLTEHKGARDGVVKYAYIFSHSLFPACI